MNRIVGHARIGQWYLRWDNGALFQVAGRDERTRAVTIRRFEGELEEIDAAHWTTLPLGIVEHPEGWAHILAAPEDE